MSNIYLKIALPFFTLFTALTLVIHAQPYDDQTVRGFLIPQGCEMPCFMGIRPGVTTVDEAVNLLKASDWVEKVNGDPSTLGISTITWSWSARKPAFIRADSSGLLLSHEDDSNTKIVDVIHVETTIPVAYVALLFNDSSALEMTGSNGSRQQGYMQTTDYGLSIRLRAVVTCPPSERKYLDAAATLDFDNPSILRGEIGTPLVSTAFHYCWRHAK